MFKLNSEGVANIASVVKIIGAKLIPVSTDYVFKVSEIAPTGKTITRSRFEYTVNPSKPASKKYGQFYLQRSSILPNQNVKIFGIR
ncbi:MAG: hypothetical protein DRP87_20025 [Spirochaetes bacterium]|nr:MAG: hypothetical protein DRP87_20025 [Spirochaetota bacterium]